jgi:hypothetical protein
VAVDLDTYNTGGNVLGGGEASGSKEDDGSLHVDGCLFVSRELEFGQVMWYLVGQEKQCRADWYVRAKGTR